MKKFWAKYRNRIIGTIVIKLTIWLMLFVWLGLNFGVKAFHVIKDYPVLQDTVKSIQDTVNGLDKAPIEINQRMIIIEKEQTSIGKDIDEIKRSQEQQNKTNIEIFKLLIEIKNGD